MRKNINNKVSTNDINIRSALKKYLENHHAQDRKVRIIEELGLLHGIARIDIAVVNGIMHGYEIKSDKDTLQRLPEQMNIFNLVFNKVTLIVGKSHLYDAINIVPDWWGIIVAKTDGNDAIAFSVIREGANNKNLDSASIARLLWREEALGVLEEMGKDIGVHSKPRSIIYDKLSTVCDQKTLGKKVREILLFRKDWRSCEPLMLSGG